VHDDERDEQLAYDSDRLWVGEPAIERRLAVSDMTLLSIPGKNIGRARVPSNARMPLAAGF
jgi:hypothetical protein